jgi:hypothetical protein
VRDYRAVYESEGGATCTQSTGKTAELLPRCSASFRLRFRSERRSPPSASSIT